MKPNLEKQLRDNMLNNTLLSEMYDFDPGAT